MQYKQQTQHLNLGGKLLPKKGNLENYQGYIFMKCMLVAAVESTKTHFDIHTGHHFFEAGTIYVSLMLRS